MVRVAKRFQELRLGLRIAQPSEGSKRNVTGRDELTIQSNWHNTEKENNRGKTDSGWF